MTKEELIKLSRENLRKSKQGSLCECYDEAFIKGYELSKKRIAELEYQLTHRNCVDCSNHSSNLRMRNLALEKENAELKRQLEMSNKVYNDNLDYSHHIEGHLTKAKEILREYIRINLLPPIERNFDDEVKLFKQAEQFLKDCEVEKR